LVASLSRIQKTLGKKDKPGVTWRARRAEQVNEILDRASVYYDDQLSMEEVVRRFRTSWAAKRMKRRRRRWQRRCGGEEVQPYR
jgi:hypothetical protein